MNTFDQRQAAAKQARVDQKTAIASFNAEFSNFRAITAHPVLEQIGNHMRGRGHEFEVAMEDRDGPAGPEPVSITLHIYPAGTDRRIGGKPIRGPMDHPQFTIAVDAPGRKVKFQGVVVSGNSGSNLPRGECKLEEATAVVVREKAVECIAESLAGRGGIIA